MAAAVVEARTWRQWDSFVERQSKTWTATAERLLTREGNRVTEAYEQHGERAALDAVEAREWFDYIRRLWMATVPQAAKLQEEMLKADPFVTAALKWVQSHGLRHATELTDATRRGIVKQIEIGIRKGESQKQIAMRIHYHYARVKPVRARQIARTEVHAATNYASQQVAMLSRVPRVKVWVATPDGRTRDAHRAAHGQRRALNEPFTVGGERLSYPGDSSLGASASNIVNCRCVLVYKRESR